ncbi:hypothetical protein LTS10_001871 [Elasticomyces elasticus]|nr:hypothetical protein LTS10_001871 [Elasticomyces elasticus]
MVSFIAITTLGMAFSAMAWPLIPKHDIISTTTTEPCTTTTTAATTITSDSYGSFSGASFGTGFPTALTSVSTTTTTTSYLTVSIVPAVTTHSISTVTDSSPSTTLSTNVKVAEVIYTGDGSTGAGWPAMSDWVSTFDELFEINKPTMRSSCTRYGQPNNSDDEIDHLKSAIWSISQSSGIGPRFILAIVMQESFGCVRVWGTVGAVVNPGLMQSHSGQGSCNTGIGQAGTTSNPCNLDQVTLMIKDGVAGTESGDGLQQLHQKVGGDDAKSFYVASRMYNSGANSISSNGDLNAGGSTAAYASNIANRLRGFVYQ